MLIADKTTGEMPIFFYRLYQDGFMFGDRTGKKAARKLKTWRYLWCFLLCPSLCPSQGDKDKNTVVPWRQRVNWQRKIPVRIKPPANHASFFHCPVRQVLSDVFWMYSLTFLSHFWMYSPMFFLRFAINVGEIIVPPIVASLMFAFPRCNAVSTRSSSSVGTRASTPWDVRRHRRRRSWQLRVLGGSCGQLVSAIDVQNESASGKFHVNSQFDPEKNQMLMETYGN